MYPNRSGNSSMINQAVQSLKSRNYDCAIKSRKLSECRKNHGIVTRIIKGQAACVQKGVVVHQGSGCGGCRYGGGS